MKRREVCLLFVGLSTAIAGGVPSDVPSIEGTAMLDIFEDKDCTQVNGPQPLIVFKQDKVDGMCWAIEGYGGVKVLAFKPTCDENGIVGLHYYHPDSGGSMSCTGSSTMMTQFPNETAQLWATKQHCVQFDRLWGKLRAPLPCGSFTTCGTTTTTCNTTTLNPKAPEKNMCKNLDKYSPEAVITNDDGRKSACSAWQPLFKPMAEASLEVCAKKAAGDSDEAATFAQMSALSASACCKDSVGVCNDFMTNPCAEGEADPSALAQVSGESQKVSCGLLMSSLPPMKASAKACSVETDDANVGAMMGVVASHCCKTTKTSVCQQYMMNPCKDAASWQDGTVKMGDDSISCVMAANMAAKFTPSMETCQTKKEATDTKMPYETLDIIATVCCKDKVSVCADFKPVKKAVSVTLNVTMKALDYDKLKADAASMAKVEQGVKSSVLSNLPTGYKEDHIKVTLSKGSVIAKVDITPIAGSDSATLMKEVTAKKAAIDTATATVVKALPSVAALLEDGKSLADITVASSAPVEAAVTVTDASTKPPKAADVSAAVGRKALSLLFVGAAAVMLA